AFLVTADVPEIYMQEFWATAKIHQHSIRFKMDTKKHIVDLESFREMLHISPRNTQQYGAILHIELTTEDIRNTTAYKEYYAYATGEAAPKPKASGTQKSKEMYYPRFTKVIIDYFMTRKPFISRRNRINWHYVRDDVLFSTIKVVSRHQTTQQYGAILPIELTTDEIRNSKAYKEYYACATGEAAPKPKASARKKKGDSASSTTPPTPTPTTTVVSAPRLSATAKDVPEIYMREFWATAKLHHNSIRFKMVTKKSVLDFEAFREMLHISPRIPSQSFIELPSEEEILKFLRYLGHSHEIRHLTDVNVNKLYQPWRSFASVINKCLTGKSSGIDSFRLSQAQILWGFYHRINVDYAYLIWEDFVYQTTQQYGAILSIELTTDDIRNSKAYKEYYACATGEAASKPKASARKKKGNSASSTTPPTQTPTTIVMSAPRLSAAAKGKQPARATTHTEPTYIERTEAEQLKIVLKSSRQEPHISQQRGSGIDEGTGSRPGVLDVPSDDSEEELSWNSSDDKEGDEQTKAGSESDKDDDDNDDEEEPAKNNDEDTESAFRFDKRLRSLETTFSEYRQTNPFVDAVSAIPSIVHQYMTQQMTEVVREAVQIQTDRLQDSLQRENNEFLRNIDENMKKIIKGKVKTDLSKMELKKILIEKTKGNKSIQRSDEQRNLYKALVEAYDADKTILDTYGESTILKRRREDDDQEGPSAGSDRGSKRLKEGGEHASASTPSETTTRSAGRSTTGGSCTSLTELEYHLEEVYKATTDQLDWVNPEGPARSAGVNVSTLSRFMMKLEKSIRVSRSSLNKVLFHSISSQRSLNAYSSLELDGYC
nr:hypothetical protein [Tanacetum cinerariifolium]